MLRDINIPTSVRYLEHYAFWECTLLIDIELPPNLESIGTYSLWYLKSIERIIFPATLKVIGAESCKYWANIKQIYCKAINPPLCIDSNTNPGSTPFGMYGSIFETYTPQDTPVYVPIGSAELYRNAWGWDYFTNFIETDDFPTAGMDGVTMDRKEQDNTLYDLFGRKVDIPCPGTLYIKNGKKYIFK